MFFEAIKNEIRLCRSRDIQSEIDEVVEKARHAMKEKDVKAMARYLIALEEINNIKIKK